MNRHRHIGFIGAVAAASLLGLSAAAGVAQAAQSNWYVAPGGSDANSCGEAGAPCATIDAAIQKAAAGDTVKVAVGTYTGSGPAQVVLVDRSVTLDGGWDAAFSSRTGVSTIDGGGSRRGVTVNSGTTVIIRSFVIQYGAPPSGFIVAGGVLNSGTLTIETSRVVENLAAEGAGIANGGTLLVTRSTISGNDAWSSGGGIKNYYLGTATVSESTISGNTATIHGGGVDFYEAAVNIRNSTVSGNTAGWDGGGIYLSGNNALLNVSSSTIAGNSAGLAGDNFGGGGIYVGGGLDSVVLLRNTILANNSADYSPDCRAPGGVTDVQSDGFNLVEDTTGCSFAAAASDFVGVDPLLAPLQANGGPTATHALLPNSLANDNGNPAGCADELSTQLTTDQRGSARPLGAACDIGAFEAEPPENDDFADAMSLDGLSAPVLASNAFGTKEAGEPDHALNEGGSSIWFSWTAPFDGTAFVSTAESDFDTVLGVYTGSTVSSLATVAASDDANMTAGTSKACFQAAAGASYRIAIDGFDAAFRGSDGEGAVTLTWGAYSSAAPCAVLPPAIVGTPVAGGMLAATTGTWAGSPGAFAYQWFACDEDGCFGIAYASSSTYVPPDEAVGLQLFVRVVAEHPPDRALDAIGYSALTPPIAEAPPSDPPPPSPPSPPPSPPPPASPPAAPPPSPPPPSLRPKPRAAGCLVPNVRGKRLSAATKALKAARCSVGQVTKAYSRNVKRGRVLSQRPRIGTRLRRNGKVNLVLSRGRKR